MVSEIRRQTLRSELASSQVPCLQQRIDWAKAQLAAAQQQEASEHRLLEDAERAAQELRCETLALCEELASSTRQADVVLEEQLQRSSLILQGLERRDPGTGGAHWLE
ncbi:unnamed protein product [Effrenium voratum]|nr:unnamed protein product [Effrenium voratum]